METVIKLPDQLTNIHPSMKQYIINKMKMHLEMSV